MKANKIKTIENTNDGKDVIFDEFKTISLTKQNRITVTTNPDGSLLLTTRIKYGILKKMSYHFYSKREAISLFKEHIKKEEEKLRAL